MFSELVNTIGTCFPLEHYLVSYALNTSGRKMNVAYLFIWATYVLKISCELDMREGRSAFNWIDNSVGVFFVKGNFKCSSEHSSD